MKRPTIADRLKAARLAAGLSQSELATAAAGSPPARRLSLAAGTLQVQISRIEAGRTPNPGLLTVEALAAGLKMSLPEFLS